MLLKFKIRIFGFTLALLNAFGIVSPTSLLAQGNPDLYLGPVALTDSHTCKFAIAPSVNGFNTVLLRSHSGQSFVSVKNSVTGASTVTQGIGGLGFPVISPSGSEVAIRELTGSIHHSQNSGLTWSFIAKPQSVTSPITGATYSLLLAPWSQNIAFDDSGILHVAFHGRSTGTGPSSRAMIHFTVSSAGILSQPTFIHEAVSPLSSFSWNESFELSRIKGPNGETLIFISAMGVDFRMVEAGTNLPMVGGTYAIVSPSGVITKGAIGDSAYASFGGGSRARQIWAGSVGNGLLGIVRAEGLTPIASTNYGVSVIPVQQTGASYHLRRDFVGQTPGDFFTTINAVELANIYGSPTTTLENVLPNVPFPIQGVATVSSGPNAGSIRVFTLGRLHGTTTADTYNLVYSNVVPGQPLGQSIRVHDYTRPLLNSIGFDFVPFANGLTPHNNYVAYGSGTAASFCANLINNGSPVTDRFSVQVIDLQ